LDTERIKKINKMETKYIPRKLSEVVKSRGDARDVAHLSTNKRLPDGFEDENHMLLYHCRNLWDNLRDFRVRYQRASKYHNGDQWGDYVYNPDVGEWQREEDYIRSQGKVPLKQNLIRQLMKNLQGQYRRNPTKTAVYARDKEDTEVSEMMTNAIRSVHDDNHISQLESQLLLDFAMSGMAVSKQVYKYRSIQDTENVFIKNVNLDRIFFNGDIEDIRMEDLRIVGEILDMPINDVLTNFARTAGDEEKIQRWYTVDYYKDFINTHPTLSAGMSDVMDFYVPHNSNMCRVIEVWYKKGEWRTWIHDYYDGTYKVSKMTLGEVQQANKERIETFGQMGIPPEDVPLMEAERRFDQFWCVKHLTPYGHTLHEGETPYDHKEHPYEIIMYPFSKGRVQGLVEDIIDQQRSVNRLITQADFIRGASAKGLLMIHEDSIPEGMNIGDIAEEWSRVGGVIKYKGKPGVPAPAQVSSNSVPAGMMDMLNMQIKLTYDIMGIHSAIQGQQARAGTAASLYAQEAENAAMNVKDFFETFNYYKHKRDQKIMMLIRQFYNEKRMMYITGSGFTPEARVYDPEKARDVNYDLKVVQGADTPVYRQVIEDILTNLLSGGLIDLEMYLEHSTMPFAEKLMQTLKRKQQQMAGGQQDPGVDQALLQELEGAQKQVSQSADPRVQRMLERMQGA
jgi:hypothetical protein